MKIILSAFFCHPNKGSEQGVGWNWLVELSKSNTIYCLFFSGEGQKQAVETMVQTLPYKENIHLVAISTSELWYPYLYRIWHQVWQIKAFLIARRIIKKERIDVIHHVTIAAWWFTGYYWI